MMTVYNCPELVFGNDNVFEQEGELDVEILISAFNDSLEEEMQLNDITESSSIDFASQFVTGPRI